MGRGDACELVLSDALIAGERDEVGGQTFDLRLALSTFAWSKPRARSSSAAMRAL